MKSSDVLLSLEHRNLEVGKDINNDVYVDYKDAYVKDGIAMVGVAGRGKDFETACDDYLRQIRGKTLYFAKSKKEVQILG